MKTKKLNIYIPLAKLITSSQEKRGFYWQRYNFSGYHSITGKIKSFFIEFYAASTQGSKAAKSQKYALVRCGINGKSNKIFDAKFPLSDVTIDETGIHIIKENILFGESKLEGEIPGMMLWDITLLNIVSTASSVKAKHLNWLVAGNAPQFLGTVLIGNEEYVVSPATSFGTVDRIYGATFPEKWFFLMGSNLVSNISAQKLDDSFFSVNGVFSKKIAITAMINDVRYEFGSKNRFSRTKQTFDCTQNDDSIHWTASIQKRGIVIDIDVNCRTSDMKLKTYEVPPDSTQKLQLLTGVTGNAEIRLYKTVGKTLELVEHVRTGHALCEYGENDSEELEED
jgi:hypothetical protein